MLIITVSGLQLQFDGDSDTPPLRQARNLLDAINESISPTEGSPCFLGIDELDLNNVHADPAADDGEEECEGHPMGAWRQEVAAGKTTLGYWVWVWSRHDP